MTSDSHEDNVKKPADAPSDMQGSERTRINRIADEIARRAQRTEQRYDTDRGIYYEIDDCNDPSSASVTVIRESACADACTCSSQPACVNCQLLFTAVAMLRLSTQ